MQWDLDYCGGAREHFDQRLLLCVCAQEKKADSKKRMLMLKALKSLKFARSNEEELVSIPAAVSMVACSLQGTIRRSARKGDDVTWSPDARREICAW